MCSVVKNFVILTILTTPILQTSVAFAQVTPRNAYIDPASFPSLTDIRYLSRNLDDLAAHQAWAMFFFSSTCELSKQAVPVLMGIAKQFQGRDVQFVAIDASYEDSVADMAQFGMDQNMPFPLLKDVDAGLSSLLGVTRAATLVLLDGSKQPRWRCGFDATAVAESAAIQKEIAGHLEEIFAGTPTTAPDRDSMGQTIQTRQVKAPAQEVTFTQHVAPVLVRRCVRCHNGLNREAFPLDSYDSVANRAQMITEVVEQGRMPPWYAHQPAGIFTNDPRLSDEERSVFRKWMEAGRPQGPQEAMPALPTPIPSQEWQKTPDLVLQPSQPNAIPATGFIPYRLVSLPYVFEKDTYLESLEIKPGNSQLVHHANLFSTKPGSDAPQLLASMVPGHRLTAFPRGSALLVPGGSRLFLQIHYVTIGKMATDVTSVGLRYCKTVVQKRMNLLFLDNENFLIPPLDSHYETKFSQVLPGLASLHAIIVHMHLRGKDIRLRAKLPDGTEKEVISVPNYDFNWQLQYQFEPGSLVLPAGTRIEGVAHFDNSTFNPFNPDPNSTVQDGLQTKDEMCQTLLYYIDPSESINLEIDPATGLLLPSN